MNRRLEKLRQKLEENQLEAILVSQTENRRYLSGFTGSAGLLLVSKTRAILATDFRYTEQAQAQAPDFDIVRIEGEPQKWFPDLISSAGAKKIGFEANDISFSTYRKLVAAEGEKELVPTEELVESLRMMKDEKELEFIIRAVELAEAALEQVLPRISPGKTEREVAWQIEKSLRERGSESVPFELIVASGPNSALPHARPTDRPLLPGEPVVIDVGARWEGYTSDITRTIILGNDDSAFARIYDLVLGAQLTAIATIAAGMSGEQADALARTVIEQGGYGQAFGHGLGHGVGLATHELPRLGRGSSTVLSDGMVFTIEPGIYIAGWGGVRIEDTVVMERGKVRVLSQTKKVR